MDTSLLLVILFLMALVWVGLWYYQRRKPARRRPGTPRRARRSASSRVSARRPQARDSAQQAPGPNPVHKVRAIVEELYPQRGDEDLDAAEARAILEARYPGQETMLTEWTVNLLQRKYGEYVADRVNARTFAARYPPDPTVERTTLVRYSTSYRDEAYINLRWVNGFVPYDLSSRRFEKRHLPPEAGHRWRHTLVGYLMSPQGSSESPGAKSEEGRAVFEKKLAELQNEGWTVVERPDVIGATMIYLARPKS